MYIDVSEYMIDGREKMDVSAQQVRKLLAVTRPGLGLEPVSVSIGARWT